MENMKEQTIGFIGLGLIGGSIARRLKRFSPELKIMAYMRTRSKLEQAKTDGVVDVILDGIGEELRECDVIFLCTPVEYNAGYLALIKPLLKEGAFITDVGSTKTSIHEEVIRLGMERVFVGGHPMAGSEKTGYEHSNDHLLENAYYIVTPSLGQTPVNPPDNDSQNNPSDNDNKDNLSDNEKRNTTQDPSITKAVKDNQDYSKRLVEIAKAVGAIPMVLDYREHDKVVAAISHLPHIVASSLVNLVKASDSPAGTMKQVAAGGFKDITRIASASPEMWEQICVTNRGPIARILENYIASLTEILAQVKAASHPALHQLFETSRDYRNSIAERERGALDSEYSFSVDIVDEPGSISTLSVILAAKGISIKNIGINHNRERGEGALRIIFYEKDAMEQARKQLAKYHYDIGP